MATIFEVQATSDASGEVLYYGARWSRSEAELLLSERRSGVEAVGGKVHDWRIREIDTTGAFQLPERPTPRERFTYQAETVVSPPGWKTSHIEVLDGDQVIASYARNYAVLDTFEPFRQLDRCYALIAPDYTATSVMDLATGEIIATEKADPMGFCPVGFYVPDWWDVHDGSTLPGSHRWTADNEWPYRGDFGFVWGCIWGDDSSWKVQYLDLSAITDGLVARDDRFGSVELASESGVHPKSFIRVRSSDGQRRVDFRVRQHFELDTGSHIDRDPFTDG